MRLFISEEIVAEINQVLNYPRLRKIYEAESQHEELIESILKNVHFVSVSKPVKAVPQHPADDKFIECALQAKANHIVSGDKHLLNLGTYQRIKIVSVNAFLQVLN